MTVDWEIIIVTVTVLASAVLSGSAFWVAGQRYHDQQERDEVEARTARKDSAEVYRTMQVTIRELVERQNSTEDAIARARARIAELEQAQRLQAQQMVEALAGIDILIEQLHSANITPAWSPKGAVMVALPVNLGSLIDKIYRGFSDEELSDLASRIGIESADVPGETLQRRARELVEMAQRRGLTGQLITVCKELRPKGKW